MHLTYPGVANSLASIRLTGGWVGSRASTLEANRSAVEQLLAAQQGKYAEAAAQARRQTELALQAEAQAADSARQNA